MNKLKLVVVFIICIFMVSTVYAKEVVEIPMVVSQWTRYQTDAPKRELVGKALVIALTTTHKHYSIKINKMPSRQMGQLLKSLLGVIVTRIDENVKDLPANSPLLPLITESVNSALP